MSSEQQPTGPESEKWRNCLAKALLCNEILGGKVDEKTDLKALHESNAEYKKWPFDRFKPNVKNLIASIRTGKYKAPDWSKSKAKATLKEDIISGNVTEEMTAEDVYQSNDEYRRYKFEHFATNLENLRNAIYDNIERMDADRLAYNHDIALLQSIRERNPPPMPIPWHRSEAKELLEKDLDDGKHLEEKEDGTPVMPKDLYQSRIEYRAFSLKVFRDHIYQELKRRERGDFRFAKKATRMGHPLDKRYKRGYKDVEGLPRRGQSTVE